ncbi:MAG: ABC transporter ATP-binding protein [Candidatus Saccharibacteria bacterium]|nr:ABC transporter ATP-binding protein [Candidatus Saccharibacteria bacterium]
MTYIWRLLWGYWWQLGLLVAATYGSVMATLSLPDFMAAIINKGIVGADMAVLWHNGWQMIVVTLAGAVGTIVSVFFATRIATGLSQQLRDQVFARVEDYAVADFNCFSTASLITRSTNDTQQIQSTAIMLLRIALMAPIMAVAGLHKALANAPSLSWIIALAVAVLLAVIIGLFIAAMPRFQRLQSVVDKLNLVARENLTGLRVVRAFHTEAVEEAKFDAVNHELTRLNLVVNRLMMVMEPVMMLIMNLASVAVVWYGALAIGDGRLAIGNMMAFLQYALQVIMSFLMISMVFIMAPRAAVSVRRVAEVLDTEPSITDPAEPQPLTPGGTGRIEFRNVTFAYPGADEPVLSNISFVAEPGQTTAFIGSTGSGKSTLVNLILRFYDVSAGQILLDGVDIRNLRLKDLASQIGYVPQKGVLFRGSIASNIAYGAPEADKAVIAHAAEVAQASDFIAQLDNGMESAVAQGGTNVSGGQRQRLAIARALAAQPQVYIFDDSFSALDARTDAALRRRLTQEVAGKTVLIVGQRINTIAQADTIIVLDEGRIVGQGQHQELMKTCAVYQEIAASQLSKGELAVLERPALLGTAAQGGAL